MADAVGTAVWVPHENVVWKKATVVQKLSETSVQVRFVEDEDAYDREIGTTKTFDVREIAKLAGEVSATAMPICNSFEKLGVDDMCTLNHLHEPAVLKNLQLRHAQSIPYTYTGQICIAVNPYKWLDLYSEGLYPKYLEQPKTSLPPHPFALSSHAYLDMRKHRIEQSILVSGESGAGKTETVKIMMHHLASVSGGGEKGSTVIDQVLKSNPLLEAFGNAKTKRNDNSSRFGKFAQLQFDASGYLIGARCETYLLEKSRVVGQTQGERNYHIFYQVFSLASELKKSLFLEGNVADYNFVKVGAGSRVDNTDDSVFLQETKDAMDTIGIDDREQHGIFEIVSAILNLGEVEFRKETVEKCSVLSLERVEAVAALLNTAASALQVTLCQRKMTAGGETYMIPLNVDQAADLRDAFAKGMYSHLFDWLVGRINRAICSTKNVASHIGLLDIFGFESFDHNGFEQLCINYANEKLQQKFNSDIFKTVQAEYVEEGIPLDLVTFEDNQPILDLIEGKLGIVDLLNETCLQPKGSDSMFVNKSIDRVRMDPMQFKIVHYAGDVTYDGSHFLDKNKDTLPSDLLELLASSQSSFIRDVFPELSAKETPKTTPGGRGPPKSAPRRQGFLVGNTIAGSFRKQLGELMDQIAKTSTHSGVPGVIAAIRISRAAFPNRLSLKEFTSRFAIICPSKLRTAPPEAMVLGLLQRLLPETTSTKNARFAIGRTKVYFSSGLLQQLEDRRNELLRSFALCLQRNLQMHAARARYRRMRAAILVLQAHLLAYVAGVRARRQFLTLRSGVLGTQARWRGLVQRRAFRVLLVAERERKEAERLRVLAEAEAQTQLERAAKLQAASAKRMAWEDDEDEVPASPRPSYHESLIEKSSHAELLARVGQAEALALEAREAAEGAMALNEYLQKENKELKTKLAQNVHEYADADLKEENDRLKHELMLLQNKVARSEEVSLIAAKVVDSRITFREGRQFVEYKLQIETNSRGTLFVWHRYSTFRNLATTLQTKNGEKIIQDRVAKLNEFLEAATRAEYLQWGIRVDQDTCVYKRRTRSSSGADREDTASTTRDTVSIAGFRASSNSFSDEKDAPRQSFASRFSIKRNKSTV
ncbi:hypothetical protein SPRG_20562 [Saprolegnia parasitica CBS 223.65]|uniref:Myosin motor domain-containing protein n=1 Tax=Saprolegnia parasitica (strain CBS 223.65) TaxID=695850 RepID=A0A067CJA5_SAPPC|nr:hypothetical protein SPRG_20562 [Saprolegnia parasitica CBS 223.65]KDO26626.1 hypothetical protein SPRG_20562 [Saprolegnia parasitica CBS 223.65]|eukprot:XP_012202794.1 hypothetical protein SPRG_20562 [Saprolegnia parasitica CBS 223.65]